MNNDITFFKLWRNIVINRVIFNYAALYKKNKQVEFYDKVSLLSYCDREYITELVYRYYGKPHDSSNVILKGDLPENGVLRIVDLRYCSSRIRSFDCIPLGVEVVHLNHSGYINEVQLSELPSSVHTISNVLLKKPYTSNPIPENITSLSFYSKMDANEFYDIVLPSSIKVLDISSLDLLKSELAIVPPTIPSASFIPSSVTDLSIHYDEKFKSNFPLIPSSVTKLLIKVGGNMNCTLENGIVPISVNELFIYCLDYVSDIKLSDNCLPMSIKKLSLHAVNCNLVISNILSHINSTPNNTIDLYISVYKYPVSFKHLFSIGLTRLEIKSKTDDIELIDEILPSLLSELPSSIKYLTINDKIIDLSKQ